MFVCPRLVSNTGEPRTPSSDTSSQRESLVLSFLLSRARSIAEISNASNYPMLSAPATPHFDTKSFHGSTPYLQQGPPTTPYLVHRGHPHPRMVMTENGAPSHLPIRDHAKSPMPPKGSTLGKMDHHHMDHHHVDHKKGVACCSGHFVVVWIILGIITFGILLGIVLKFTVA